MTGQCLLPAPAGPITRPGQRVLASGALKLRSLILALDAGGAEVIASDVDPAALTAAFGAAPSVRCMAADLDLTLDMRRLALAVQRSGGCDTVVHHMGGDRDGGPDVAADAFLRAMRLIHAMRPLMRHNPDSHLFLTGCPSACAVSMAIVLDRAGNFCARTGPRITACTLNDLPALLRADSLAAQGRTMLGAVALAG